MSGTKARCPNANDYVVKSIGPQSVIMTRDEQGKINLLLNRCSHRGNQVCSYDKGNARSFTCPFHSWTFANDGRLVGYAFPDGYEGQDKSKLALGRVTRVQSYRGFVFGSFAAEGPTSGRASRRCGRNHRPPGSLLAGRRGRGDRRLPQASRQGQLEIHPGERMRRLSPGLRAFLDLRRRRQRDRQALWRRIDRGDARLWQRPYRDRPAARVPQTRRSR